MVSDNIKLEVAINQKAKKLASYDPEACRELRKLHWKDTQDWETLLPKNAGITAQLALSDFTQNKIKSLFTAPTAFRAIKKEDPEGKFFSKYDLSSFKSLFLAGERADPDTIKWACLLYTSDAADE